MYRLWQDLPPAEIQLARIGMALGLKAPDSSRSSSGNSAATRREKPSDEEMAATLAQAGMPIVHGPLDPMIAAVLDDLPLT